MNKKQNRDVISDLVNTGWQSWSTSIKDILKIPLYKFRPDDKEDYYNFLIDPNIKLKAPSYGWCSWYEYGLDINEDKILKNAKWVAKNKATKKLPLDYILIDDGWSVW